MGNAHGFKAILIDFVSWWDIPNNFQELQYIKALHWTCGPSFWAPKWPEISIFNQKWRLKVYDLDSKLSRLTLLVVCIFQSTFLWILIHSGCSLDLWTSVPGPKSAENQYFLQKCRLKFNDLD